MRLRMGFLLAMGLAATWFGLGALALAVSCYCNGKITYFPDGWSFGCSGDCPPPQACVINRQPLQTGYADVCACDDLWITACCHLVGVVTHVEGQQDTITAGKSGQCNPPNAACPAGTCQFVFGTNGQGNQTVTAACQ